MFTHLVLVHHGQGVAHADLHAEATAPAVIHVDAVSLLGQAVADDEAGAVGAQHLADAETRAGALGVLTNRDLVSPNEGAPFAEAGQQVVAVKLVVFGQIVDRNVKEGGPALAALPREGSTPRPDPLLDLDRTEENTWPGATGRRRRTPPGPDDPKADKKDEDGAIDMNMLYISGAFVCLVVAVLLTAAIMGGWL